MASGTTRSVVTRPPTYQAIIGALQSFWERQGCVVLQPYHTEVGAGTFNPATFLRCLDPRPGGPPTSSPPAAGRRPLRREPLPPRSLLPVPGGHQALAARHPGSVPAVAAGARRRPAQARHPLRRGQLGRPHAGRLGPGLGGLGRRHGDHPVHLLPAAGRLRLRPGDDRAHLRPRAHRHVPAGRRQRLRHRLEPLRRARRQRTRGHLRRRLPRERARVQPLQLRGLRRRHAVPPLRRVRGRGAALPRRAAAHPRLRLRAQVQPRLQHARRARRDQRDRPHRPHLERARPGAQGRRPLPRGRGQRGRRRWPGRRRPPRCQPYG